MDLSIVVAPKERALITSTCPASIADTGWLVKVFRPNVAVKSHRFSGDLYRWDTRHKADSKYPDATATSNSVIFDFGISWFGGIRRRIGARDVT